MIEYWKDIIYLIGILAAFITGNKAKKILNKGGEIDNLMKYQLMYEKFSTQFESQLNKLEEKTISLEKDIVNLELRNAIITEESEDRKTKFDELQKLYNKLYIEFMELKKKHL